VSEQQDLLSSLVKAVAAGEMLLHDDRQNLMSKEDLLKAISANRLLTEVEARDLLRQRLIIPVDEDSKNEFHVAITLDFLNLNYKLEILGYSLHVRQKIAEMYYPLFWALSSDVDSEVARYQEEQGGRAPSHLERAYVRVISEWAVANTIGRVEERILRLEPEGGPELERLLAEMAKRKGRLKKYADFGFQETEIEKAIKEIWLPPFRYFHGREIKAFLDIKGWEWTRVENRLLWGGHFDFALCDSSALLRLVVEYNGTGHYGRTSQEARDARSRDETKRRICEKAGIPMFSLTPEFAFVDEYREMLKTLLLIFRTSPGKIDPQFLHDRTTELLNTVGQDRNKLSVSNIRLASDAAGKLDAFTVQKRPDMLLALLWEVCFALDKRAKLAHILNSVRSSSTKQ
jgi:hypothetical protein